MIVEHKIVLISWLDITDYNQEYQQDKIFAYNLLLKELEKDSVPFGAKIHHSIGKVTPRKKKICRIAIEQTAKQVREVGREHENMCIFSKELFNFPHRIQIKLTETLASDTIIHVCDENGLYDFADKVDSELSYEKDKGIEYTFSSTYHADVFVIHIDVKNYLQLVSYKFEHLRSCIGVKIEEDIIFGAKLPERSSLSIMSEWLGPQFSYFGEAVVKAIELHSKKVKKL